MKCIPVNKIFGGCLRSIGIVLVAVFLFSGCAPPAATVPIETAWYGQHTVPEPLLLVYLPGRGDPPSAFEDHGLFRALREKGIAADMVGVNAHLGYYLNGSMVRRLKKDVIDPAKARGYARIWLVGNSLGGYGSLAYMGEHRGDISGVVLLGPYLGEHEILREVLDAGGLETWDPGPVEPAQWQKRLFLLFKDYHRQPDAYPPVYLGYGKYDRFAASQKFLAELLPPECVIELNGGHEWWTWKRLWEQFLEKDIIK